MTDTYSDSRAIADLLDEREIGHLKYRYLRTLGTKQCDELEATGDYNGLVFADRSALVSCHTHV